MKLSESLAAAAAAAASRLGNEGYKAVLEVVKRQEAAGLAEDGVQLGEIVPEFELPSASGKLIRLNDLLDHGPAVIVFYRGGWCPFCTLQLKALQESRAEIEARGAKLVAISLERPDAERSAYRNLAPDFELLHDKDGRVARLFGLLYDVLPEHAAALRVHGVHLAQRHGSDKEQLVLAATYVVAQDGTVAFAFVDVHPERRADPAEVIAALDRQRSARRDA